MHMHGSSVIIFSGFVTGRKAFLFSKKETMRKIN